ncbi:hypothetical protein B296_00042325 [Ensete ventricosum]|uniref:Uncharacterized protein n=1 Tax=Ensete ventricosum TaxID=4639 RepID=A0A426XB17_ENSVE|nr:hypothetical protein B296_00042325 [Ensete ventricosum]
MVTLNVKAPPRESFAPLRAPMNLVALLGVSRCMIGEKLRMLKRAMQLVVSSLGLGDQISSVAFSTATSAKRHLPLR